MKNRLGLGILLSTLLVLTSSSCVKEKTSVAFVKGPYLQNVQQHSMTIMWETENPTVGAVEYWNSKTERQLVSDADSTIIHEITLSGLT